MLSDAEVAERRQAINEDAYFQVLKAMVATQQAQHQQLQLQVSRQLRILFNVSNHQHKAWYEELRAQDLGALDSARGPSASMQQHASTRGSKKQAAGAGGGGGGVGAGVHRGAQQGVGQHVVLQRTTSRKGSKTSQHYGMQQQYQQQQPQQHNDDARVVGYKVAYQIQPGQWMDGVITEYLPGSGGQAHIVITFHLYMPSEFQQTVRWEQSENLKMINEVVDLTAYQQRRWQQ